MCFQALEIEEALSKTAITERLTADTISEIYCNIKKKYYDISEFNFIQENNINWVKNSMLLNNTYAMEYIMSESTSFAIANSILEKKVPSNRFIEMLSLGSSMTNDQLLNHFGITHDPIFYLKVQFRDLQEKINILMEMKNE